jgi:hypothetical protein
LHIPRWCGRMRRIMRNVCSGHRQTSSAGTSSAIVEGSCTSAPHAVDAEVIAGKAILPDV